MTLENYYYYFQSAIPPKICDEIIKYGLGQQEQLALTAAFKEDKELSKEDLKDLNKKRNSDIVWMDDTWIYNEIHPYINQANAAADWNFDWDWAESIQFTKYKENQFYGWHCDSADKPYDLPDDLHRHGKIRKLSVTVCLSDETEYEGGDFEFDFRNNDGGKTQPSVCKEIRPKGSVIVFPSFVWHRVKPVTSGTRYSLVMWNLGKPFR